MKALQRAWQWKCCLKKSKTVLFAMLLALAAAPPVLLAAETSAYLYTVRPGDNLWNLTERYLISMSYWRALQRINKVERPRYIPPGTRLRIPIAWMKVQPTSARVIQVQGKVTAVSAAGGTPIALAPGDELNIGQRIMATPESSATLEFADGSRLLLQGGSELVLDKLSAYGDTGMVDTRMRLPTGRVESNNLPSKGPGSRFEIKTPSAVAAVRGTNFRVSADATVTRSEVIKGRIGVAGSSVERAVRAGFGTVTESGKPPELPRKLLPAPDASQLSTLITHVSFGFTWSEMSGAVSYRCQIYPRDRFDTLLLDRPVSRATLTGIDLPDGDYVLRLRAVDPDGLEGLNADHRFTVDARPLPPILADLIGGVTIREPRPTFRWSEPEQASAYHFQLSTDAQFQTLLVDETSLQHNHITPATDLPFGGLYWRVATIDRSGEQGPFSDTQDFELKPVPAKAVAAEPEVGEKELVLSWGDVDGAARYQFQLAEDKAFSRILVDEYTTESKLVLPKPNAGTFYMRVRVLDADNYAGPYGEAQRIKVPVDNWWPVAIWLIAGLLLL